MPTKKQILLHVSLLTNLELHSFSESSLFQFPSKSFPILCFSSYSIIPQLLQKFLHEIFQNNLRKYVQNLYLIFLNISSSCLCEKLVIRFSKKSCRYECFDVLLGFLHKCASFFWEQQLELTIHVARVSSEISLKSLEIIIQNYLHVAQEIHSHLFTYHIKPLTFP